MCESFVCRSFISKLNAFINVHCILSLTKLTLEIQYKYKSRIKVINTTLVVLSDRGTKKSRLICSVIINRHIICNKRAEIFIIGSSVITFLDLSYLGHGQQNQVGSFIAMTPLSGPIFQQTSLQYFHNQHQLNHHHFLPISYPSAMFHPDINHLSIPTISSTANLKTCLDF